MAGPLMGIRMIEMVGVGPAPFAAMWFADMGAEVIRIDRPGDKYNQTRTDLLNRGRRGLAVNLKREGASDVVLRLVKSADVLIEGFRPGVMERLGIGPEPCLAVNPRLVYARMTGWGQDGPLAQRAGHDINYLALTGILATLGAPDQAPPPPLNLIGDFGGGGMLLIAGVMAALLERQSSGKGQVVDAAMFEGANLLATMIWGYHHRGQWTPQRQGNLFDGGAPFYRAYRCADGKFVALGAIEAEFWKTFLDIADLHDPLLREHQRNSARFPEIHARLEAFFLTRTRDAWAALFDGTDACVTPVLDFSEAPSDRHAQARSALSVHNGVAQPAPAPRFSRTPGVRGAPPTFPGEHSRAILADWGFKMNEIDALQESGVVDARNP